MKNDRIILRGVELTFMNCIYVTIFGMASSSFMMSIVLLLSFVKLVLLCIHHVGIQVVQLNGDGSNKRSKDESQNFLNPEAILELYINWKGSCTCLLYFKS